MNKFVCAVISLFVLCGQLLALDNSAHCRISVSAGSMTAWGSGTLIKTDGDIGYVLTCHHLFEDKGDILCSFPNGERKYGRLIRDDKSQDIAVVIIRKPSAKPIEPGSITEASQITVCGYGGNGQFRASTGRVTDKTFSPGCRYPSLVVSTAVRSGDSGGAALDQNGRIVGVVWGCDGGETWIATGEPFKEITQTVCYGGTCYGGTCYGGTCYPSYATPVYQQPTRPPVATLPPPPPAPTPAMPGPTGPQGPAGPPGPAGKDATCPCGPRWTEINAQITAIKSELADSKTTVTNLVSVVNEIKDRQPQSATVNFLGADGKIVATATVTPGQTSDVTLPPINFRIQDQRGAEYSTEFMPARLGSYVTLPFGPAK